MLRSTFSLKNAWKFGNFVLNYLVDGFGGTLCPDIELIITMWPSSMFFFFISSILSWVHRHRAKKRGIGTFYPLKVVLLGSVPLLPLYPLNYVQRLILLLCLYLISVPSTLILSIFLQFSYFPSSNVSDVDIPALLMQISILPSSWIYGVCKVGLVPSLGHQRVPVKLVWRLIYWTVLVNLIFFLINL